MFASYLSSPCINLSHDSACCINMLNWILSCNFNTLPLLTMSVLRHTLCSHTAGPSLAFSYDMDNRVTRPYWSSLTVQPKGPRLPLLPRSVFQFLSCFVKKISFYSCIYFCLPNDTSENIFSTNFQTFL